MKSSRQLELRVLIGRYLFRLHMVGNAQSRVRTSGRTPGRRFTYAQHTGKQGSTFSRKPLLGLPVPQLVKKTYTRQCPWPRRGPGGNGSERKKNSVRYSESGTLHFRSTVAQRQRS